MVGKRTGKVEQVTSKSSNRAAGQQKQQGKSSSGSRVRVAVAVAVAVAVSGTVLYSQSSSQPVEQPSRGRRGSSAGLSKARSPGQPADWTVRGKRPGQALPLCASSASRTALEGVRILSTTFQTSNRLPFAFPATTYGHGPPIAPRRRLGRF